MQFENITTLKGSHGVIEGNDYSFNYHLFIHKLEQYNSKVIQDFVAYKTAKKELTEKTKAVFKIRRIQAKSIIFFC